MNDPGVAVIFTRRGLIGSTHTVRIDGKTVGVVRWTEMPPGWLLDTREYYRTMRDLGRSRTVSAWFAVGGFNLVGDDGR